MSDEAGSTESRGWVYAILGAAALIAAAFALLFLRRRRADAREAAGLAEYRSRYLAPEPSADPVPARRNPPAPPPPVPADPPPAPAAPAMPAPVSDEAARDIQALRVSIEAQAAAFDGNEVQVKFAILVHNTGESAAEDVTVAAWLRSAHAGQDAEMAKLLAAPASPYLQAMRIEPGDTRRIDSTLALPAQRAHVMTTRERRYCVPLALVDVRWRASGERRKAAAFMIGESRADSAKLGPVFLDRGPTRLRAPQVRLHHIYHGG